RGRLRRGWRTSCAARADSRPFFWEIKMDSARWHCIQTLFHEAADLSARQRQTFLKEACGDDDALMAEVLAMLEQDSRGASLLNRNVASLAHGIVGNGTSS